MKLLKSSVKIVKQAPGITGMYKMIELTSRVSHKSEDKITASSAKKFLDNVILPPKHYAALRMGTVYLKISYGHCPDYNIILQRYSINPYSEVKEYQDKVNNEVDYFLAVTTNYEVLYESKWLDDLKYWSEPTEFHPKRICSYWLCDRGVSAEANRHTHNGVMEASTRYCNFSKDKFGNEVSIVQPDDVVVSDYIPDINTMCSDIAYNIDGEEWNDVDYWLFANLACEFSYMTLTGRFGWTAQRARRVLPLDLKTEIYHTAFLDDWKHFFDLRDEKHAHPDMYILAHDLHEQFIKKGFLK